jgi:hypothetical protein
LLSRRVANDEPELLTFTDGEPALLLALLRRGESVLVVAYKSPVQHQDPVRLLHPPAVREPGHPVDLHPR